MTDFTYNYNLRLTPRERAQLEYLANLLRSSRNDVLRIALAMLHSVKTSENENEN